MPDDGSDGGGRRGMRTARVFRRLQAPVVLILLALAYTLNFIDRTILATIGQAIKVDLKITDTQLGLLGGLAFAILYTLLGMPIARLAERWNRVSIIALSIVVWSAFTAACGLAANFASLAGPARRASASARPAARRRPTR